MIRKYTIKDMDAVIEAWFKSFTFAHPFLNEDFVRAVQADMRKIYLPKSEIWVAEHNQKIVGFISLKETDGDIKNEIGGFFVDPDYHGQKFGFALMEKAVEEKGSLKVEVFQNNPSGVKFYERYGFTFQGEYFFEAAGQNILKLNYIIS